MNLLKKLFLLIPLFFLLTITTFAEETNKNSQFQVSIIPNNHQVSSNSTFFDLLLNPKEETELGMIITNLGGEDIDVTVEPTNATTTQNGEIDYGRLDNNYQKDSSLKISFIDLIDSKKRISLGPNESKTINFHLKAPEKEQDGIILGGFVVYADHKDIKQDKNNNILIQNKYEIRKAVRIQMNKNVITPKLKLNKIAFNWIDNTPALTANIQNITSTMFGDITINSTITEKKTGKIIKEQTTYNMEMAPNSNFYYPIFWYDQEIIEGDYHLDMTVSSGSETWKLNRDFDISKNESTKFADFYEKEKNKKKSWIDYFIVFLVFLIPLIIIFVVIYIKYSVKKKKKNYR